MDISFTKEQIVATNNDAMDIIKHSEDINDIKASLDAVNLVLRYTKYQLKDMNTHDQFLNKYSYTLASTRERLYKKIRTLNKQL